MKRFIRTGASIKEKYIKFSLKRGCSYSATGAMPGTDMYEMGDDYGYAFHIDMKEPRCEFAEDPEHDPCRQ